MLKFNNAWRFHPPATVDYQVVNEFSELIGKIAAQGDLQEVLEHFKHYFAGAAGATSTWSSSASWAETDLHSKMSDADKNAPLFIAAFYDACETLRTKNPEIYTPDAALINGVLAKHEVEFELRPPNFVACDSLAAPIAPSLADGSAGPFRLASPRREGMRAWSAIQSSIRFAS